MDVSQCRLAGKREREKQKRAKKTSKTGMDVTFAHKKCCRVSKVRFYVRTSWQKAATSHQPPFLFISFHWFY